MFKGMATSILPGTDCEGSRTFHEAQWERDPHLQGPSHLQVLGAGQRTEALKDRVWGVD